MKRLPATVLQPLFLLRQNPERVVTGGPAYEISPSTLSFRPKEPGPLSVARGRNLQFVQIPVTKTAALASNEIKSGTA